MTVDCSPRSAFTLAAGAILTTLLLLLLGLIAQSNGLLTLNALSGEIHGRLSPKLLELGIALAARAHATYVKVNPGPVSFVASSAIAVALVPPV